MEPEQNTGGATKYIVSIVIIILIIIGISFVNRNKKSVNTPSNTTSEEVTGQTNAMPIFGKESVEETIVTPDSGTAIEINYTDENGFTPDNVSVKIGDTVKFVNRSQSKMWVASDDHPTHTTYNGTTLREHCPDLSGVAFDQCENGSDYSFTFTKAGSWNYHNHSRAGMKGAVIVTK